MSRDATGSTALSVASGLMMRPSLRLFFLMYTQTFFVTSVRGNDFAPQIAASASLSFFGAKMPFPAFFMAATFFLAVALWAALPMVRFSAFVFLSSAFVIVVFVFVTVGTVVLVTVIAGRVEMQ